MTRIGIRFTRKILVELFNNAGVLTDKDSWERFSRCIGPVLVNNPIDCFRVLSYGDTTLLYKLLWCLKYLMWLQKVNVLLLSLQFCLTGYQFTESNFLTLVLQ